MNEFDSYKKYNFNPGFSEPADFLRIKDEKNKRILMEEQYNLLQIQKAEILAQKNIVTYTVMRFLPNKNTAKNKAKVQDLRNGSLFLILLLPLQHYLYLYLNKYK